jgi:enoyl-CoA hydratase/carnithine racemase
MLYTGRRVTGEEALRIGLADRMVEADALRREAHALALDIASSAPLAIRAIRRTMRGPLAAQVQEATHIEHLEQRVLRQTDDHREGVTAVAERREPTFHGR